MKCIEKILVLVPVVLLAVRTAGAEGVPSTPPPGEVALLRGEIQSLREDYERRIAALEARLSALEAPPAVPADVNGFEPVDLEALRAAARAAVEPGTAPMAPATTGPPPATGPVVGHERNLNRLNPEISFTGDVLGTSAGGVEDFEAREFELDLQAVLDPFSSTKWTLDFGQEEVEIEEGYLAYHSLPGGFTVRAGKMRQTFGAINRVHRHALPQADYPLVLEEYFGAEGLAQTGISVEWLVPRPWSSANEVTLQITDGSSEPFGGDSFESLVTLLHLKNYWDLTPAAYIEWGLSGASGSPAPGLDSRVLGTDLTFSWQPPARAKYRAITWRTEILLSQRDDPGGVRREAWGGYSYIEGLLRRNLSAGIRYDRAEDPLDPSLGTWSLVPYLTWWQSEFVRLRGEIRSVHDDLAGDTDHGFGIQFVWSAGPHKHEQY